MRYILACLILLTISISLNSQERSCGTVQTEQMNAEFAENKANWDRSPTRSSAPVFIPVTFHLVARNDRTGRSSEKRAYQALCKLNENYERLGTEMYFYVKGFNEINDTEVFEDPFNAGSQMSSATEGNSLNIFIVDEIGTGNGIVLGYYSRFGDYIAIRKQNIDDADYTLEHEIGHFFTLKHTHYGWEDEPYTKALYGEKIEFTVAPESSQAPGIVNVELVDRSNCNNSGDDLCDTPPDYGLGFTCNCCEKPFDVLDKNCEPLNTIFNNVMSYSGDCTERTFTDDQVALLKSSYNSNRRSYLRTNLTENSYRPITAAPELIYPDGADVVEIYNDVLFRWEPVENADFYVIQINDATGSFTTNVTGTEFRYFDLPPGDSFLSWTVNAFSTFGGSCPSNPDNRFFATGTTMGTDDVIDLPGVSDVKFFPNPLREQKDLIVEFESSIANNADLFIYDMSGKVLYKSEIKILGGSNRYVVPHRRFTKGVNLIEIRTETGKLAETIIVD